MAHVHRRFCLERHGDHDPMPCQPQRLGHHRGAVRLAQVFQQVHGKDRVDMAVLQWHSGGVGGQRAHVSAKAVRHGIEQAHGPGGHVTCHNVHAGSPGQLQ